MCSDAQSSLTLCDPMECSSPGSSVHGILQARILEWVATLFSRESSQPSDQACASCISGIACGLFTTATPGKPPGWGTWTGEAESWHNQLRQRRCQQHIPVPEGYFWSSLRKLTAWLPTPHQTWCCGIEFPELSAPQASKLKISISLLKQIYFY